MDKSIPGESKRIKSPKSCNVIKLKPFINTIDNSSFIHIKTANKYNKKTYTNKTKRKS